MRPLTLIVSSPFVSWLSLQVKLAAERLALSTEDFVVTDTHSDIQSRLDAGDIRHVIFVTVHAVAAIGGKGSIEALIQHNSHLSFCLWNVDCVPLVYRSLPKHPNLHYVHASADDAKYWREVFLPECQSDFTMGVGPHQEDGGQRVAMSERDTLLFAPINLRWCGRTLSEILSELEHENDGFKQNFQQVFETCRNDPALDIPHYVFNLKQFDLPTNIRLTRYAVYAIQLWRRERLVECLLDFPVLIDSNFMPDRLIKRAERSNAKIVNVGSIRASDAQCASSRAVLSCSSSHDLYHDRVSTAFQLGAIPVLEQNAVFPSMHQSGECFFYDIDHCKASFTQIMEELSGPTAKLMHRMELGARCFELLYPEMGFERLFYSETCAREQKLMSSVNEPNTISIKDSA